MLLDHIMHGCVFCELLNLETCFGEDVVQRHDVWVGHRLQRLDFAEYIVGDDRRVADVDALQRHHVARLQHRSERDLRRLLSFVVANG